MLGPCWVGVKGVEDVLGGCWVRAWRLRCVLG